MEKEVDEIVAEVAKPLTVAFDTKSGTIVSRLKDNPRLIYCGEAEESDEVTITRDHILDLIEEKAVPAEFFVLESFDKLLTAKKSVETSDFVTHINFFEELWELFHKQRVLIPIQHTEMKHYTILEVMNRTLRIKHYNTMVQDKKEGKVDQLHERAKYMAYQISKFINMIREDAKTMKKRTRNCNGTRVEVVDEINGVLKKNTKFMSNEEQMTWDFVMRRDLKNNSYEFVECKSPQVKDTTNDTGSYLMYIMETLMRDARLLESWASKYRGVILESLVRFWNEV